MRINFAIAFLLGVISTLLAVLVFRPPQTTFADAVTSGSMLGVAGNASPGSKDIFWLVDNAGGAPRLCLYQYDTNKLMLLASRDIHFDMIPAQYSPNGGTQDPTVEWMKKETAPKKP